MNLPSLQLLVLHTKGDFFCFVLCNVFTPTRKALDIKYASQSREKHKYTKEDEDICIAVV